MPVAVVERAEKRSGGGFRGGALADVSKLWEMPVPLTETPEENEDVGSGRRVGKVQRTLGQREMGKAGVTCLDCPGLKNSRGLASPSATASPSTPWRG